MKDASVDRMRRLPLSVITAAIFAAVTPHLASALTLLVTDCTDGPSPGTLRNTIAAAPDNSVIQIPLMCSKITLDQGRIFLPGHVSSLYIVGQSPSKTIVTGPTHYVPDLDGRLFQSVQYGGVLGFSQMTLENGSYTRSTDPKGGCIFSTASIALNNAVVTHCTLHPDDDATEDSKGGAIFAYGSVTLLDSEVSNSVAIGGPYLKSLGGGIYARGAVNALRSTVTGNIVRPGRAVYGSRGGGIFSYGDENSVIRDSTISGNVADSNAAAEFSTSNSSTLAITSSTIADNYATVHHALGAYLNTTVTNSTIAFNVVGRGSNTSPAGLYSDSEIAINNSIFANNVARSGTSFDIWSNTYHGRLSGSANLITATVNVLPLGTITSCPRLGHLTANGGPTQTIPLLKGSPAIDVGAANGQTTDQRGYSRTVGAGTDIGAYERQAGLVDDVIFFSEFESRCN